MPTSPNSIETLLTLTHALVLRARSDARGQRQGIHPLSRRGASNEFREHKAYAPLDDVRRLDWKAYARQDKRYVKLFQDETQLDVHLIIDASGSMNYGEGLESKWLAAHQLALGLMELAHAQGDSVRATWWQGAHDSEALITPAHIAHHSQALLQHYVACAPQGRLTLRQMLCEPVIKRGGLHIVISDFLDASVGHAEPSLAQMLHTLRLRECEVWLCHIQHRDERDLPWRGAQRLSSMEEISAPPLNVDSDALRTQFKARTDQHRAFIDEQAKAGGAHHQLFWTDEALAPPLIALLNHNLKH